MTRSDLIDRLAQMHPQLQLKDAELAVKVILDALTATLTKGERIEIRGFGSFVLNYKPPRQGRNPNRSKGKSASQVCAAFQGGQGAQGEGG